MYLSARPTQPADYERCFAMARDRDAFGRGQEAALFRFWEEVFGEGRGTSAVIEDEDRPRGRRIVGFGLGVFVATSFMEQLPAVEPYIGPRVLGLYLEGRCPVLSQVEIRAANSAAGLDYLGLHSGWAEGELSAAETKQVWHAIVETFAAEHRGLRLRSFCTEVYGERERRLFEVVGAKVWSDYEWYFARHPAARPVADRHPYLMGMTRADALEQEGKLAFSAFFPAAPRFSFTPRQQGVLRCALAGQTDVAIAANLGLSLVTVKKLWNSIYARVAARAAPTAPGTPPPDSPRRQRGSERRRTLLNYLRQHPEELRPLQPRRRERE